jgi:hypothetical protein
MSDIITPMADLDIAKIRADVEPFQSELTDEFYLNYAGLKEGMSTAPIYSKYAHLFSGDAIGTIKSSSDAQEGAEDVRWLRYLLVFSTMGHMDNAVKELTDKVVTFEAGAEVELEGKSIPYRSVPIELRNEPDHDRRTRLFDAKLVKTEQMNILLLERMSTLHELSGVLGFKNYRDLCSTLKGVDYRALEEQMEELLRRTEQLYTESMDELLKKRAGLSLTEAWTCDIPFAFKGEEFDKYFQKSELVGSLYSTLRNIGLEPDKYDNVHLDMEERPRKTPRAFCAPVKVPDDIRLVMMPVGGWKDFETFFHESGHAWHFGNTDRRLPAEYRYLGDNSVTESFAFLFAYLASNKLWLQQVLGMKQPDEYVRFFLTNKLMFLRRYAAKLTYELKMHNSRVSPEFGDVYRTCLQRALRFRHTEKHYLEDLDDGFYCAEYLRAWILEGQLREAMTDEFGEDWFRNDKAGARLKELWSYGQKFKADELVKTVGFVDLDPEPMLREIERGLSG